MILKYLQPNGCNYNFGQKQNFQKIDIQAGFKFGILFKLVKYASLILIHITVLHFGDIYMNEFAIKFKEDTTLICADDKHKVLIGESVATSTGVRNKSALTPVDGILNSCDHDFTKLSLTPSASLFVDIPNNISDSFYQG